MQSFYNEDKGNLNMLSNILFSFHTIAFHINGMEEILEVLVHFFIVILEFMGLIVIVITAFQSFYNWIKKDPQTRLHLAEGMAMALEFKLGSEILRTVTVREMDEIYLVAAIILLRAALTFLIHWEIKNEKSEEHHHK